jgi:hypothetical protein
MEGFVNDWQGTKKAQCDWLAKKWAEEADLENLKVWAREQRYSFYYSMPTKDILNLVEEAKEEEPSMGEVLAEYAEELRAEGKDVEVMLFSQEEVEDFMEDNDE